MLVCTIFIHRMEQLYLKNEPDLGHMDQSDFEKPYLFTFIDLCHSVEETVFESFNLKSCSTHFLFPFLCLRDFLNFSFVDLIHLH